MIYLLLGDNTYARDAAAAALVGQRTPEKFDGEVLGLRDLPDLFLGQSLFVDERLLVIKAISGNMAVWNELETYLKRMPETTTVIFIETKPDKRTKTYRLLQKLGEVREFSLPKSVREAEQFVLEESNKRKIALPKPVIRQLVARTGLEPWELVQALEKLHLLGSYDEAAIQEVIEASPTESVFLLFEAALRGDSQTLHRAIQSNKHEDPYRLFGLLSAQAYQLAAALAAEERRDQTFGVSPFVLQKLRPYARRCGKDGVGRIVATLAKADLTLKTTSNDPWMVIETALQKIARSL